MQRTSGLKKVLKFFAQNEVTVKTFLLQFPCSE